MITAVSENNDISTVEDSEIRAMIEAGVHIGHTKSKRHPGMAPYIWTVRGGIAIIDVVQTKAKFEEAAAFLKNTAAKGGLIIFVGTRPASRRIVHEIALRLGMPYVTERWIGGTLTNFKVIAKRIEILISLEEKKRSGELVDKYTKKERLLIDRDIERLKKDFDGLRALGRLPAALFVVSIPHDEIAVREARRMNIPVVALSDTNANPDLVSYPIPSNDDAIPAVRYILERIAKAVEEGKNEIIPAKENSVS